MLKQKTKKVVQGKKCKSYIISSSDSNILRPYVDLAIWAFKNNNYILGIQLITVLVLENKRHRKGIFLKGEFHSVALDSDYGAKITHFQSSSEWLGSAFAAE